MGLAALRVAAEPIVLASNPFATRFIRPGAIEYLYPAGQSGEALVEQLRAQNWQGQIIGPHGSGKSTLVAALAAALAAAGRKVVQIKGQEPQAIDDKVLDTSTQVIVDGFEQLSWWAKWKMKQHCRRQGAGLLVTAHSDMGFPTLVRTEPSLELACAVVGRLLPAGDNAIESEEIARAYEAVGGNIREMLLSLYDVYQVRLAAKR
jgi:energy-coupling factor transporter ATP-binding protein EcfA2